MAAKGKRTATNMVYGFGAAIVILGALFKIQHWPFGSEILTLGMVVEALVFGYSALERQQADLDWSLVYPQLKGGKANTVEGSSADAEGVLSKKMDALLKEAKIDAALVTSLGDSLRNFESAAKELNPTKESMAASKKYSEEMALAATQMEALNNLYKVQMESFNRQSEMTEQVSDNAGKLKEQMASLATNLSSLNGVYGGMLSAMNTR
ncbi:MAG: gliding motility protein GldL [Bacteroidetes bacterium]|jgi:gliding motility-associated protein GldL|nr:gliding motility protein GldL [Bacteroidota bacterium]MDA0879984.1 gliding motility protein GldL [Bacteroidota bacterium]MDA1115259.1 gliding motility protein GldL [Bacteroidota bacterium]MDP4666174.1 gliding motility protein GldL [Flavobacteriaceae bacterium]